jgi:hypothetical protein
MLLAPTALLSGVSSCLSCQIAAIVAIVTSYRADDTNDTDDRADGLGKAWSAELSGLLAGQGRAHTAPGNIRFLQAMQCNHDIAGQLMPCMSAATEGKM